MSRISHLSQYRKHLEERYRRMVEQSSDYKYIDETKSDRAAFKAMKIRNKLNRINYFNKEFSSVT